MDITGMFAIYRKCRESKKWHDKNGERIKPGDHVRIENNVYEVKKAKYGICSFFGIKLEMRNDIIPISFFFNDEIEITGNDF